MTTSSSLPSFPSALSWSKDESAQKVKYILTRPTSCGAKQIHFRAPYNVSIFPSLTFPCPPLCCFLSALLHEPPLHQLPSRQQILASISILLMARPNDWNCVVLWKGKTSAWLLSVWPENLCLWCSTCSFFLMLSFFAPEAWVADDLENILIVQSLVVIKQPPFENTGKHVIVKCLFLELLNSYF